MSLDDLITRKVCGFHQMILNDINSKAKSAEEALSAYKRYIEDIFIALSAQAYTDKDGNVDIDRMNELAKNMLSFFEEAATRRDRMISRER